MGTPVRAVLLLLPLAAAAAASAAPAATTPAPGLIEISRGFEKMAAEVGPAVVLIHATGYVPGNASQEGEATCLIARERSTGAGVILDAEGYIVTNAHVVGGAKRVQVALARPAEERPEARSVLRAPGKVVEAKVLGVDLETDLAVLKVDEKGLPHLVLADSDEVRPGQLVLAFGSPLGLENSVSMGVVSAGARQLRPEDPMIYIQTDAPINPGNSGGPLIDAAGRTIGINTLILSQSGGSEGIGFAAPSNIVKNVYEQIRATGRVQRGTIGVHSQTLDPLLAQGLGLELKRGVVLGDVFPGSPAAEAGLEVGDVVLSLDGKWMENGRQLEVNLYRRRAGDRATLELLRGSGHRTVQVAVVEREDDPMTLNDVANPEQNVVTELGILAIELDDRVRRFLPQLRQDQGVVVAARSESGFRAGQFEPGDVIYSINRNRITSMADLRKDLEGRKPGEPLAIQVERDGRLMFLAMERY